jgi:hypothetical protein
MALSKVKMAAHALWITAGAVVALGLGCLSLAAASPEEEIARLDRIRANLFEELIRTRREVVSVRAGLQAEVMRLDQVRANLFEELVRARREVTSARAQLEAASTDRDRANAELARINQAGTLPNEPSAELAAAAPQLPPAAIAAEGSAAQSLPGRTAKDTTSKLKPRVQDKAVRSEPSRPMTARKLSRALVLRAPAREPTKITVSNPRENGQAETYSSWTPPQRTAPAGSLPGILRLQQ